MTTHTVAGSVREHAAVTPRRAEGSRAWAFAGIGAAVAGAVGIGASMSVDAVYDPAAEGDAAAIVNILEGQTTSMLVFHTFTMISALLVVVFAAGLKRRLDAQAPAGSLLPTVAGSGLLLVSVAGLMGSGLDTEFVFGFSDADAMVPEVGVFYNHWIGTIPWLWVGAGLAAVALAVAALRHAAAPRWIGLVSAVVGGITLLLGISPLQYMAGMTGPIWLLLVSLGFAFGDRATR